LNANSDIVVNKTSNNNVIVKIVNNNTNNKVNNNNESINNTNNNIINKSNTINNNNKSNSNALSNNKTINNNNTINSNYTINNNTPAINNNNENITTPVKYSTNSSNRDKLYFSVPITPFPADENEEKEEKEEIELKNYDHAKRKVNVRNRGKSLLAGGPKRECDICHNMIETHLLKIHYNSHPSEIYRWLFLGTFSNACDVTELRRIGITYILNCAAECQNCHLPEDIKELHLNIRDEKDFGLIQYFEEANVFLNKIRLEGSVVLVHCKYGISRSVSFIIAYLIKYFAYNVKSAIRFLKTKRYQINPNEGFLTQLYNYEKLFKTYDKA
jgi:hypothetical protein